MKIFNTLSGEKEQVTKDKKQKLFVCGPTVYDFSHIGHARTYVAFDMIVKYLRSIGFEIEYVQNITDVDDKIIKRAKESEKSPLEISNEFEKAYFKDMEKLSVDSIDEYVKASDVIPEIIKQVQALIDNGFAYETSTGIYFKVRKFKDYGKLSNQNIDELQSGSRIEIDEEKEDPLDFVLWKVPKLEKEINNQNQEVAASKITEYIKNILQPEKKKDAIIVDGEPLWESPWGWGRPGWHIEDTAISESRFGPQYDIHGGAEDLKFPHHESEIAQQEAASGKKPFVRIWMHTGFLTVDGEKMGKSLNNFITIRDFLKDHSPRILRWIVINNHYRSKINYTDKLIEQSKESLNHLETFLEKIRFSIESDKNKETKQIKDDVKNMEDSFHSAMSDDLNTPKAISAIFTFIKKHQKTIWNTKKDELKNAEKSITKLISSLGLKLTESEIPEEIEKLVEKREKLRSNEQFMQSDELRNKITELGYKVEDTPIGQFVTKNNYGKK